MAITSTGYQAPATSRQGLKPSVYDKIILIGADEINYTRAYNGGADVDPRLAGQGIFYAIEKDIAAQAYTPEIYAARLKQRGFSDESAQAFTQAYVQKDINIAKDWANGKAAEVYENDVRTRVAAEIKAKNEIEGERAPIEDANSFASERERMSGAYRASDASDGYILRDGGEANLEIYEGNGVIDFSSKIDDDFLRANATELEPSSNLFDFLAKTKNNPSRDKILNHFADKAGERDSKALDHRMAYLNYIMPTIEEPLIKIFRPDGRISNIKPFVFTDVNSKTKNVNFLSIVTDKDGNIDFITAYALKDKSQLRSEIKKGIKVEVRRGLARTFDPHSRVQVPSATDEIISQKGNLVNETETNGLRDSVSSIGDNASRAGGRQAGDEQILRQGRLDTTNASQTKRPAQSDEQVEQPGATKADGANDASAAGEQVVEKQGSGASIGGGLTANSNVHLGSGLVAGTLNSIDEDGNFSPERFAAGFLTGLAGSKAAVVALRKVAPKLYENLTNTAKSFSDKGIKKIRGEIEKINGITPIKEFGENYAEFYHNGEGAIQKILKEGKGQVTGAFYREDIGDVTLPWGEVFRRGEKIKGYGVAKIIEKHGKEILNKLPKIFETGNLIKQNDVHYRIESGDYVVGLSSEFKGEKHNFVLTAFERNERKTDIFTDPPFRAASDDLATNSDKGIIPQNLDDAANNLPKPEDIIAKHPNVERELDESIAAMREESFNDSNFKAGLISKFDTKEITTQELGKSVNLSDKQLAVLKNDIKNADFKVINESKIYFDKIGKDGDKKRFFVDIAQDGSLRVDAYAKSQIDNIPVKQSALEELAGTGDAARLKGMSFEVKAAYRNELDPIKKEAILKTAELNKLKKAAQSGDKAAVAKFEEFKAKNLDENGNIKDGLSLC
jgi:hypothetical protein